MTPLLRCSPEVSAALACRKPVVALESTLIAHGLPWPTNLETALAAEAAVRDAGAIPATIGVWHGEPVVGLNAEQIRYFASSGEVRKASRRDLAAVIIEKACAATTVAATMTLAAAAGLRVFATGGIGGVHPPAATPVDVSADLFELARTPVAVVCAGAKSILDLPATIEVLEALGVPVLGFRTDTFPAFYLTDSGLPVSARVESAGGAARFLAVHWALGGAGVVISQPLPEAEALDPRQFAAALAQAQSDAGEEGARGPALTPFLLRRLAERTGGATLRANQALIIANARLAAAVARALAEEEADADSGNR
jgi:pseudouridine-5'-phosphate glycosidase